LTTRMSTRSPSIACATQTSRGCPASSPRPWVTWAASSSSSSLAVPRRR
jgi:hypothetical protein